MAKQRLTDKTLASSVSVNDIVHIVKTGDTSQNPAGSSYKATISQVVSTFTATSVTALTFNNISYDLTLGLDDGSSFTDNLGILASDIKVTGGTYNPATEEITFVNNSGGTFVVSGVSSTFTGNTSGSCITDLYVSNLYGCSPITLHDRINSYSGNSYLDLRYFDNDNNWFLGNESGGTYTSFIFGDENSITTAVGVTNQFGLLIEDESIFFGGYDSGSIPSYLTLIPNGVGVLSENNLPTGLTPTQTTLGIVRSDTNDRYFQATSVGISVSINSGSGSNTSKFNSGVTRSVAVGGEGLNIKTNDTAYVNQISFQEVSNTFDGILKTSGNTADRTYTLQDSSGTVAFLSDITTFTGNTSGTCITDLYLTNLYGCSPINIQNDTIINGGLTGTSGLFSSTTDNVISIVGSGSSTSNPLFSVQGSSGELFSITDSLEGSLFSVNDISGLPILDVNSDSTIQMGNITAPSLFTTVLTTATGGTENIYSLPTSAYTGGFFEYTLVGNGGARSGRIDSIWSGTTALFEEFATNDIGASTSGITFDVSVSGNDAILSVSAITGTYTIKTIVRSI